MSDKLNKKKSLGTNSYEKKQGRNEKKNDYEDLEAFEDYNHFVKATGWKTSSSVNQKHGSNSVKKSNNSKLSNNQSTNKNSTKSDNRKMDSRNVDSRKTDNRKVDSRNYDNRKVDSKKADSRNVDSRMADSKRLDSREVNSRKVDSRRIDNRIVDTRKVDYRKVDTTKVNDRKIDNGKSDAWKTDIGKPVTRKTDHGKLNTRNIDNENMRNKGYSRNKDVIINANENTSDREILTKLEYQSKRGASELHKGACPKRKECGGCNILRESYQEHLSEKQKNVEKLLKKYCKVEPIIGMEKPEHYRNKVHVVFDHDRKGNPISGVYEEGTHKVVPVEKCLIHNEKADAIIATIRGMLKSFKILTYDEDTGYGLLRHVLIRTGYHSGEILVVLVLASPILPSKNNFVKALRKEHPEITTVVVNVNDKKTSMVLGDKEQVIYGKGYIEDTLCDKTFRISPKSFYQVNPRQTEVLYRKAVELAKLTGEETVVDAYCGIGTIGIIASEHAKKVIGVELNKDAVKDAVMNAKINKIENIEFYQKDAGIFLSQMAEVEAIVDVVIMDPPRTGSTNQFMDAIASIRPKKVVYISCNQVTLERDLEYLTKKGYKSEIAVPVDMFPWTGHTEVCCLLTRRN